MLSYPLVDPVAIAIGPIAIYWYGLMYAFGFLAGWWLGRQRSGRPGDLLDRQQVSDLLFYCAVGVVAGGRLGYILFYDGSAILSDPLRLLRVWEGGMSFHGGLIGVGLALLLFARKQRLSVLRLADFVAPLAPVGLGLGRIGNFINGELWGKPTDLPWGVYFPPAGMTLHPSQLYQAVLEGVLLFVVVWVFSRRQRPVMAVTGVFLAGYGVARILVEFVRLPDAHIGYLAFGWLTMGQLLSLPMLIGGMTMLLLAYRRQSGHNS